MTPLRRRGPEPQDDRMNGGQEPATPATPAPVQVPIGWQRRVEPDGGVAYIR